MLWSKVLRMAEKPQRFTVVLFGADAAMFERLKVRTHIFQSTKLVRRALAEFERSLAGKKGNKK
jgi:hypothetical protein